MEGEREGLVPIPLLMLERSVDLWPRDGMEIGVEGLGTELRLEREGREETRSRDLVTIATL